MNSPVPQEVAASAKALPALGAFVWLLPGVSSLVDEAPDFITEGFPAQRAFIRLLPGMEPLVDNQGFLPGEAFPTS